MILMVLTRSRVAKNGHADRGAAVDLIDSNWEDEEEESACDNVGALSAKATEEAVVKEDAMLSEDAIAADREKATDPKTWPAGRPRSRTNNTKTTSKSKLKAYEFSQKNPKKKNQNQNTVCSEGKKQSSIMAREIRKHCARGKRETRANARERTRAPRQKRRARSEQSHLHASPAGRPQTDNCIHPTTSTDYGSMVVSSFRLRG